MGINTKKIGLIPMLFEEVFRRKESCSSDISNGWRHPKTLQFIERRFLLRTCSDRELKQAKRPCLQYQMHQCMAPCVGKCTDEEYQAEVDRVVPFCVGTTKRSLRKPKSK